MLQENDLACHLGKNWDSETCHVSQLIYKGQAQVFCLHACAQYKSKNSYTKKKLQLDYRRLHSTG